MPKKKIEEKVVSPATSVPIVKTAADQIWDEIKNLNINMFALANQKVHMYCKPVLVEPSRLFLLSSVGSALPALEAVVAPKYSVEKIDKFLVVAHTAKITK